MKKKGRRQMVQKHLKCQCSLRLRQSHLGIFKLTSPTRRAPHLLSTGGEKALGTVESAQNDGFQNAAAGPVRFNLGI